MRKLFFAVLLLAALDCHAQTDWNARYTRQVKNVGYAGVGVETILDSWEAAEPDNILMMEGRINYFFTKGCSSTVISGYNPKYLGKDPILTVNDSTGRRLYYFEDILFDDEQFALCQKYIDKCRAAFPNELLFCENKFSTMLSYEKDSPELACAELMSLVGRQKSKPEWTLIGEAVDEEYFASEIMSCCFALYSIGTQKGYECFRDVSMAMNRLYPKNVDFINNIGSYYLVAENNPKKALKYYRKTLKLDPDNDAATRNSAIAQKRLAASK